jgi:hypothetical protein
MIRRAAWPVALFLTAACFSDRVRLDVPQVTLELAATQLPAGGTIEGQVLASDGSGVVQIGVRVTAGDSVMHQQKTGFRSASAELVFSFVLPTSLPAGAEVEVLGWARDDQDFRVEAADTVRITVSTGQQ